MSKHSRQSAAHETLTIRDMMASKFRLRNLDCRLFARTKRRCTIVTGALLTLMLYCCYLVHYDTPNIKLSPIPKVHIEPHLGRQDIFLLILVTSTPWRTDSFDLRETIRITWGLSAKQLHILHRCVVVFNMGRAYSSHIDERIADEAAQNDDILVGNYQDSYTNLILKVVFSFDWASKLNNSKFVLKVDEDVYVRIPGIVQWLRTQENPDRLYAGVTARYLGVDRLPWETYFVSYKSYNVSSFPQYCLGLFYVISSALIPELQRAVPFYQVIPIEDIYVGLLMNYVNVRPRHLQACTGKIGLMPKLKACGDCFYYNSICIGHSLTAERILYIHARFSAVDVMDQNSLKKQCTGQMIGQDPWRAGKCTRGDARF